MSAGRAGRGESIFRPALIFQCGVRSAEFKTYASYRDSLSVFGFTLRTPRSALGQSLIKIRSANIFEGSFTPFDSSRLMNVGRTPVASYWP